MKTKQFNRTDVRSINSDIEAALQSIAKKYGVRIQVGNSRFSSTEINTKVSVAIISENGVALSKEAKAWDLYASLNGITFKVGDSVLMGGKIFTIRGWNTKAPKFPIVAEMGGKQYKLTIASAKYGTKL